MTFDEWLESTGIHPDRLERKLANRAWDAARALPPEGRTMVLVKPTPEMLIAGGDAFAHAAEVMLVQELQAGHVYAAMINACQPQEER